MTQPVVLDANALRLKALFLKLCSSPEQLPQGSEGLLEVLQLSLDQQALIFTEGLICASAYGSFSTVQHLLTVFDNHPSLSGERFPQTLLGALTMAADYNQVGCVQVILSYAQGNHVRQLALTSKNEEATPRAHTENVYFLLGYQTFLYLCSQPANNNIEALKAVWQHYTDYLQDLEWHKEIFLQNNGESFQEAWRGDNPKALFFLIEAYQLTGKEVWLQKFLEQEKNMSLVYRDEIMTQLRSNFEKPLLEAQLPLQSQGAAIGNTLEIRLKAKKKTQAHKI